MTTKKFRPIDREFNILIEGIVDLQRLFAMRDIWDIKENEYKQQISYLWNMN